MHQGSGLEAANQERSHPVLLCFLQEDDSVCGHSFTSGLDLDCSFEILGNSNSDVKNEMYVKMLRLTGLCMKNFVTGTRELLFYSISSHNQAYLITMNSFMCQMATCSN